MDGAATGSAVIFWITNGRERTFKPPHSALRIPHSVDAVIAKALAAPANLAPRPRGPAAIALIRTRHSTPTRRPSFRIPHSPFRIRKALAVIVIRDQWRIDDRWWTASPVSRMYCELELPDAQTLTINHDMVEDLWYEQRQS